MARVAKIDNAFKKRFKREEKNRSINTRNKRVFYLIVCEGEKTEPNYFMALEKKLPVGIIELQIEGTGRNTIGLVNHTLALQKQSIRKYDHVWAVFDRDSFPSKNFNSAIITAVANNIKCAWSNEAFELWFLLHFQLVNNAMSRNNYQAFLEREIQIKSGNTGYKYQKNATDTYSLLNQFGNQTLAIRRAKGLIRNFTNQRYHTHNPCTYVFELIEELNSHKLP